MQQQLERASRAVLTVHMSPREFDQLTDSWATADEVLGDKEHGRFRDEGDDIVTPAASLPHVYSFGENYASVLLAKAFLDTVGAQYEVIRDMGRLDNEPEDAWAIWRIFTDYQQ